MVLHYALLYGFHTLPNVLKFIFDIHDICHQDKNTGLITCNETITAAYQAWIPVRHPRFLRRDSIELCSSSVTFRSSQCPFGTQCKS